MSIQAHLFSSKEEEILWISSYIKNHLQDQEIAIIGRRHKELEQIAHIFIDQNIPVLYERRENVLDQAHIRWLIQILRLIESVNNNQFNESNILVREILSYPFWELEPVIIYDLAIKIYETKLEKRQEGSNYEIITWLSFIQSYECNLFVENKNNIEQTQKVQSIAKFLINISAQSHYLSVEQILDWILGIDQNGEYNLDLPPCEENFNNNLNDNILVNQDEPIDLDD
jgi:hypothetical protein